MTASDVWDAVRGMTHIWEYCETGTARDNAHEIQAWLLRDGRRASLSICARVAAEIRRQNDHPGRWIDAGIGAGFGQTAF